MATYLKALSLRNYRGIGDEIQRMPDFRSFNFFIGANNSGKSTVLNFISKHLPLIIGDIKHRGKVAPSTIDSLERHGGASGPPVYMEIGVAPEDGLSRFRERFPDAYQNPHLREKITRVFEVLSQPDHILWVGSEVPCNQRPQFENVRHESLRGIISDQEWQQIWSAITNKERGDILAHWIPETLEVIASVLDLSLPQTQLIPAIREIGPKGAEFNDFSGRGLIDRLAQIQNPTLERTSDRLKFDKINEFLREVTSSASAVIQIPHDREHILVEIDGRTLPLSSLGTGIQEVIMIGAFCLLSDEEIICIEEPEIHLHPLLQRKLMNYLRKNTNNQYFIATHSSSFIDTEGAAIFHVELKNNTTNISEALLKQDRYRICTDLGYKASDILQSNAIIWVEGPSDRIYLNCWIKSKDPLLIEGIHYSIMFYGGRLLSHLTADDKEISEFIQLRSLNRNVAIIMDSDKKNHQSSINETKLRIKNEFESNDGIAWITKGREIENYIDYEILQNAVKSMYPDAYERALPKSPYSHALYFERSKPKKSRKPSDTPTDNIEKSIDKVKVSRIVSEISKPDFNILDLDDRICDIVDLIQKSNR